MKCKTFFSERRSRHSQGTNGFTHPWKERVWLNTRWHLAHQALRKLDREQCTASWWPLVLELQMSQMTHLTSKLYTGPKGDSLAPSRWRTVCLVTQGRGMPAAACKTYSYSPTSPPSNAST